MINTKLPIELIELVLARFFNFQQNIIVPKVSYGYFATHEADLLICSKFGYLTEIEIKRSWTDFLADFKKNTTHDECKVMWKYFAVPASISEKVIQHIMSNNFVDWGVISFTDNCILKIERTPNNITKHDKEKKLTAEEQLKIARLGCMRYWSSENKKDFNIKVERL